MAPAGNLSASSEETCDPEAAWLLCAAGPGLWESVSGLGGSFVVGVCGQNPGVRLNCARAGEAGSARHTAKTLALKMKRS